MLFQEVPFVHSNYLTAILRTEGVVNFINPLEAARLLLNGEMVQDDDLEVVQTLISIELAGYDVVMVKPEEESV